MQANGKESCSREVGPFAKAIASGRVEVNRYLTPEQHEAFAAQVQFLDRVVMRGMIRVEAERRELIARERMTEDGRLIYPPDLGNGCCSPNEQTDSFPEATSDDNRLSPEIQPTLDCMLAGLNSFRRED